MAVLQASFFSHSLMRSVLFNAIIPIDKMMFPNKPIGEERRIYKTLYLLAGVTMNHNDWLYGTRILNWAEEKGVAVIMPAGENKFFLDSETTGDKHANFLGVELIEATRQLFPLSYKREDTFIAGLSMGGYGAIRTGLIYHETFGYIAGMSSVLILERLVNPSHTFVYSENKTFGDRAALLGSDRDPMALVKKLVDAGADIPKMYISCGTEDGLIHFNRSLSSFLNENGVEHVYIEEPGKHDWDFWDRHIYKVLEWLPL